MNSIRFALTAGIAAVAVALASCGGGGSSNLAEGGIGGTGISRGSITQIGSIWVNGVEYETGDATITADGEIFTGQTAQTDAGLTEGMVVTVTGTVNADGVSGTADTVTYSDNLEGPIESIEEAAGSMTVFGRTILVDQRTRLEEGGTDLTFSELDPGNVIEVSGFEDTNGKIHATFIERRRDMGVAGTDSELTGVLNELASNPLVNTSMLDLTGFAATDYVEVKGILDNSGVLVATDIESAERDLGDEESDEVELEGLVTSPYSAASGQFTLDGQTVMVDPNTEFDGGVAADIRSGVRLEVEGSLSNRILTASEVSFEESIELESQIKDVDVPNNAFTLEGDPFIGLNIKVGSTAEANLSTFNAGDHVQVRGFMSSGTVVATKLELSGDANDVVLQGTVDSFSDPNVTVLGNITVDTTGLQFEGDGVTDSASFFTNINTDAIVEFEGTLVGTLVNWQKVELDD